MWYRFRQAEQPVYHQPLPKATRFDQRFQVWTDYARGNTATAVAGAARLFQRAFAQAVKRVPRKERV